MSKKITFWHITYSTEYVVISAFLFNFDIDSAKRLEFLSLFMLSQY